MSPTGGGSDIDEYSATGLPPGLSIDDTTGVISGTPGKSDAYICHGDRHRHGRQPCHGVDHVPVRGHVGEQNLEDFAYTAEHRNPRLRRAHGYPPERRPGRPELHREPTSCLHG